MLKYNIDYEIMGMMITLIIAYTFRMYYVSRTKSDKAFMRMVYCILVAQVLDMITAFTFSMETPKLNAINSLLTTGYFFSALATSVAFERYIVSYIAEVNKNKFYEIFRKVIIMIYCIHGVLNPVTKLAFYFTPEGKYEHGPLYFSGYLVPALFAIFSLYFIIRYRNRFGKKQWISSVSFVFVVFGGMILQAGFVPDVYLTFGLVPLTLLMILFSLETPDYRKLMQTMEELEEAKQEAWRANRVKSDFLANMSHEIRTPINAILGFDEMILRESGDKEVLSYAANIKNSGHTLLSLVNDILDLSKIEAGKMEIVKAPYDTAAMLSELLKMIAPRAIDKGLKLYFEIDGNIPKKLLGDDVRINQVLSNLLTNAVKYTPKGSVTLKIRVESRREEDVVLYFAVKDTGIGIKQEDMEKLFTEFGRVEGEKTHRIEGTGLGLPITMKCLGLMDSKLEVDSTYGEGSEFHFLLTQHVVDATPIGDFAKDGSQEKVEVFREDFVAPDAHILVVDDVEMNLKVFQGLLKKSLLQIDTAQSGMAAIEMIRKGDYDLVFMDHQMPEMDGIETLKRLKADETLQQKDMPIIALTANAIAGARDMYLENGFSDYLTKPIDGFALSAMIHKWLPAEKIQAKSENGLMKEEKTVESFTKVQSGAFSILEFAPVESKEEEGQLEDEDSPENKEGHIEVKDSSGDVLAGLWELSMDVDSGLEYAMNDKDFYLELVGDFVANAKAMSSELEGYYRGKDWKNYQIRIHALKGTAKTIGAMALSEEARALEYAARDRNEAVLYANHEKLIQHYEEFVHGVDKVLGKDE